MKYVVDITETTTKYLIVDATNEYQAKEAAINAYTKGKIQMGARDYYDTNIDIVRKADRIDCVTLESLEV